MSAMVKFVFRGDELDVVQRDGLVWVSVKRVCEVLGIDYATQLRKLKTKPWATVGLTPMVGEDGKRRNLQTVDLDTFPMWLSNIETANVNASLRPKLEAYQRECAAVLRKHFVPDASIALREASTAVRELQGKNIQLETRLVALEASLGGVIGDKLARQCILDPLQEAARYLCAAASDMSKGKYRSALKDLETQVRMHVQFPAAGGQKWANLPIGRLGDAQCKVAELKHRAQKAAGPVLQMAQTDIFGRMVADVTKLEGPS